ncbi:hypothetical protein [Brevundimonas sp.]|uniref:hypothetical protein n=1 Tax=Brevundimonas sp. TaxID=1871086 RepID=UPI0026070981|nr:hypothetical protein [Brevundimonas sp.]
MTPAADMHAAAKVAGLSWDRFRKVWPRLVLTLAFPAPFAGPPYRWEPARLDAWREASAEARRAAILSQAHSADIANDDHPVAAPPPVRRGRAAAGRSRILKRLENHA